LATTHVHASCRRFISRTGGWRSALTPVNTRFVFTNLATRPCGPTAVPFGFWCGGFSSTAGYVSGNEAQSPKTLSDYRLLRGLIISQKRDSVFIRVARFKEALRPLKSKPSLSACGVGCDSCNSRLLLLSNNASPHHLPFPLPVTTPVSIATRMWVIRSAPNQVKQKIL
jgi:hypothetical protein